MIAYNKTWLANLQLRDELKKDLRHCYLNEAEFKLITEKYPVGFYSPNLLVRVGLFILTCVIVFFADGLLSLMAASSNVIEKSSWFFFLGALSYTALELMVNLKFHYRSGVDDALLFISMCLLIAGFAIMVSELNIGFNYFPLSGTVLLLSLFLSLRFADMLTSAVSCIAFFAFIFFGSEKIGAMGLTIIPFIMMLASVGLYWLSYTNSRFSKFVNYENCLIIAQIVALLTLYASGNYYIVQTLSDQLNGQHKPIAFAAFFWIWTMVLPFVFIWFGLKKKDAILLRTGLILTIAAAATFRTYYQLLPIDVMLTLAGAILLGIAYAVMKYLKTPKYGFTYAEPDEGDLMDRVKLESLVIAQTFSHAPAPPADKGVKFGGGDFGGGGSSGDF